MASEIKARLCILKLWPDFNGYGFNLHGEKNKTGHFIGDVEEYSPAHSAGLKRKDRLIEVNGNNVYELSHKDVVQLIKSGEGTVAMLVVTEEIEELAMKRGIPISATTVDVERIEAVNSQEEAKRKTEVTVTVEPPQEDRTAEEQRQYEEAVADSIAAAAMEALDTEEPTPAREPEPPSQANGVTVTTSVTTNVQLRTESSGADQNGREKLTAAQFRASLQSKKKQDPRKSGTSFKDKTAMFEKM